MRRRSAACGHLHPQPVGGWGRPPGEKAGGRKCGCGAAEPVIHKHVVLAGDRVVGRAYRTSGPQSPC